MSPLLPGLALSGLLLAQVQVALTVRRESSSSGLLTLTQALPVDLTLIWRSVISSSSPISCSQENSSLRKSSQTVVQPTVRVLSSHFLNSTCRQVWKGTLMTRYTYSPLPSCSGNSWLQGRQMISLLLMPMVSSWQVLSGLVTSIWKKLLAGRAITMVGLGVFLLKLGFSGSICTAESSSFTSLMARILTLSLLRMAASAIDKCRQIFESVGFLYKNLVDLLGISAYQEISPSCRKISASPEEQVMVQRALEDSFWDLMVTWSELKVEQSNSPRKVVPYQLLDCFGFSLGGRTMWMLVAPFSFFLVRLTLSKSKTLTSRSPCWIWMLRTISSFLMEVRRYLLSPLGSSSSVSIWFSMSSVSEYLDWTWKSISEGSWELILMKRMHLSQGSWLKVVILSASCNSSFLLSLKFYRQFQKSSPDLQTVWLMKGNPYLRVTFTVNYWAASIWRIVTFPLSDLCVVKLSRQSCLMRPSSVTYSMLNLLSRQACARMQIYGFLSRFMLLSSNLFLMLAMEICVSRLPNLKSLASSAVGQRGLDSSQTLPLSCTDPIVKYVKKVIASLSRAYLRSTSRCLFQSFFRITSIFCFSGTSMKLLVAMILNCESCKKLLQVLFKLFSSLKVVIRRTQLGQQFLMAQESMWMNLVGVQERLEEASPLKVVGKGHSAGLMDLSSVFQRVYMSFWSTKSDLQRIVMLLFLFFGRKQKWEFSAMALILQEFQIPSFSSMIVSFTISVTVMSISTSILLTSLKKSSQFSPALALQSYLATYWMSMTSDSVSMVYSLISSSLSYSSVVLTSAWTLSALFLMLWVQKLMSMSLPGSYSNTKSLVSSVGMVSNCETPASSLTFPSFVDTKMVK